MIAKGMATWAALVLLALPAVMAGPAAAQGETAIQTEPFPITARAEPEELYIGLNPDALGTTEPVRIKGRTVSFDDRPVRFAVAGPGGPYAGEAQPDGIGNFDAVAFTPEVPGEYEITVTAPDGRGEAKARVVVHETPDVEAPDEAVADAVDAVSDAVEALTKALSEDMPESPAKDEALAKLGEARKALDDAAKAAAAARVESLAGALARSPELRQYAGDRGASLTRDLAALRRETQRVRAITARMSSADLGCHQLSFSTEVFKAFSALLNIKRSLLGTALGLSADIIADFTGNGAKAAGASPAVAFAAGQIAKNAPSLHDAEALAGNLPGFLADTGAFLSDAAFSQFCVQYTGPVRARMQARFFQPEEWWSYSFELSGRITLYYPKSATGPSIRMSGRIEGVAHSFETAENAPSVICSAVHRTRSRFRSTTICSSCARRSRRRTVPLYRSASMWSARLSCPVSRPSRSGLSSTSSLRTL